MQGTWIWFLVWEDSIALERLSPCAQLLSPSSRALGLKLLKPVLLEPMLCNKRSQNNEKPVHSNEEQPLFVETIESLQAALKSQHDQKKKTKPHRENLKKSKKSWVDLYLLGLWPPTPVLLPGKSHGWRSLVGCRPWSCKELDTTERLYFHFSLSCIGEGNGNPLQCSCLENPRDEGAW